MVIDSEIVQHFDFYAVRLKRRYMWSWVDRVIFRLKNEMWCGWHTFSTLEDARKWRDDEIARAEFAPKIIE